MAIESNCTGCGNRLSVAEEHIGKKARCPACGMVYVVGGDAAGGAAAESPAGAVGASGSNHFGLAETSYGGQADDSQTPWQYWMKAGDGSEYGPVDRGTLDRWFQEGRIAANYQVREGETGQWQQASVFQMQASANPYASSNPYAASPSPAAAAPAVYPKADQSGLILAMGILGLFLCGVFAIVAWVMGHNALKDMQAGAMDPTNKGLTQVGYYMGMVSVILHIFGCGAYFLLVMAMVATA
jgi:hypothetical protein